MFGNYRMCRCLAAGCAVVPLGLTGARGTSLIVQRVNALVTPRLRPSVPALLQAAEIGATQTLHRCAGHRYHLEDNS